MLQVECKSNLLDQAYQLLGEGNTLTDRKAARDLREINELLVQRCPDAHQVNQMDARMHREYCRALVTLQTTFVSYAYSVQEVMREEAWKSTLYMDKRAILATVMVRHGFIQHFEELYSEFSCRRQACM